MMRGHLVLGFLLAFGTAQSVLAQDSWVQVEAQPTLREAEDRARAYAGLFPNVAGYALPSGWYAVVLGPFPPEEAQRQLDLLRNEKMIPADSYIADGDRLGDRFWPAGVPTATAEPAAEPALPAGAAVATAESAAEPAAEASPEASPEPIPEETPREARAAEAALSTAERQDIQLALQWFGVYQGGIDGAFGPGTRGSIAQWQAGQGAEETGVLTTRQRTGLIGRWQAELAELGLRTVAEEEAGIEIALPMNLLEFDGYEPPFVKYKGKNGSDMQVLLISQQGDQGRLFGLYDLMQTLSIVPLDGPRNRGSSSFSIEGRNSEVQSFTEATLSGGLIKGFTLVTKPDDPRAARVLAAMKQSFRAVGDRALDEGLGQPLAVSQGDLTSGLEVRKPVLSRSGFYIDGQGTVLTTDTAVAGCGRVTIDGGIEADPVLSDAATGIAVLVPRKPMAPRGHAAFQTGGARAGGEVAVAGYSYGDALDAPVMTFGTLADTRGLDGEDTVDRLALKTLPGDAGGPVLDGSGSVLGLLLPRATDGSRVLPDDVAYARDANAIATALAAANRAPEASTREGAMAPEDLSRLALAMTVRVSCWK